MEGIGSDVKLSWGMSFLGENGTEPRLSLVCLASEIRKSTRQREQQDQSRAEKRHEQRGLERKTQSGEVKPEGCLAYAESVHRNWNHLNEERYRNDDRELRQSDRNPHAVGDRGIKRDDRRLDNNGADKTPRECAWCFLETRKCRRQPFEPLVDPVRVEPSQWLSELGEQVWKANRHTRHRRGSGKCCPQQAGAERSSITKAGMQRRPDRRDQHQREQSNSTIDQHDRGCERA